MLKLKNSSSLTIRTEDINLSFKKPELIKKLRKLTIRSQSGMNYELTNLYRLSVNRPVDCKIILAYQDRKLVAWAFLSKEPTDFYFPNTDIGFKSKFGFLFEIFVHPLHRRKGIGSALLKKAQRQTNGQRLCVCPHDVKSKGFYGAFKNLNAKIL